MSIQFSGISSGLPVNDIISQLMAIERQPIDLLYSRKDTINAQKSQYSAVSTRASNLRSALTKLTDAKLSTSLNLFEAKKSSSTNESAVTATVTNDAARGNFTVDVVRLATATKANSTATVGNYTTGVSSVSAVALGTVTTGKFSVYVNNEAFEIDVLEGENVQQVLDKIDTAITNKTGNNASLSMTADGKVEIRYRSGNTIRFGANGDTSNFAQVFDLNTGTTGTAGPNNVFTTTKSTSTLSLSGTLIGNGVGFRTNTIAAGTITIGGSTFDIDATTTLSGLMSKVNTDAKANVLMSYNANTNKIEITSKKTGNQAITLDDGGTNFLSNVNLVSGTDSLTSQTMGVNAQLKINGGSVIESLSNSVDSSVTGLVGVTLNLLQTTSSSATIEISQDTDKAKSAVSDFVTKFNTLISYIDEQTAKDAILNGESQLTRFRNDLRKTISESVDSSLSDYTTLREIGISTGSVNTTPGTSASPTTFSLDETTFLAAMANDPDSVKKLLIGDGTTDGIMNRLETLVKSSLDSEYGLFAARDKSASDQIKGIDDAIKKAEDRLIIKEKQLRAQFTAMELLVSQFKSQQSALANIGAGLPSK